MKNKINLLGPVVLLLSYVFSHNTYAQDSIRAAGCRLSLEIASAGEIEECQFRARMNKYKKDSYQGVGQFILGSNLAQSIAVKFTESVFGSQSPIEFNMSHFYYRRTADDSSFPLEGRVKFEVKNAQGELISFVDADTGDSFVLDSKKFRFYVLETKKSFEERLRRAQRVGVVPAPEMPFIAVGSADMTNLQITFFERTRKDPYVLIKSGVFKGK
jgi:hypothetical protein